MCWLNTKVLMFGPTICLARVLLLSKHWIPHSCCSVSFYQVLRLGVPKCQPEAPDSNMPSLPGSLLRSCWSWSQILNPLYGLKGPSGLITLHHNCPCVCVPINNELHEGRNCVLFLIVPLLPYTGPCSLKALSKHWMHEWTLLPAHSTVLVETANAHFTQTTRHIHREEIWGTHCFLSLSTVLSASHSLLLVSTSFFLKYIF